MTEGRSPDYETVPYPRSRVLTVDFTRLGREMNLIHGLIEVNVTEPRRRLREHRERTGEAISFTAFVAHCVGAAVAENRMLHAYRGPGKRLFLFDEVDINILIEVELEGRSFPLAHVLRAVDRRTVRDLHDEIRRVQTNPHQSYSSRTARMARVYTGLPTAVRLALLRLYLRDPRRRRGLAGTVSITAVGMFGEGGGWGIPLPFYTLCITLGGIGRKPALAGDAIVPAEFLDITLTFDHDIVDGAPATRFADRLRSLLEAGSGLENLGII